MILDIQRLSKSFGSTVAVDDVSFGAEGGEILGLLGPNGAGKSTLVHMIAQLIAPDAGRIRLFGEVLATNRSKTARRMNIASPYAALPGRLTVRENLAVYAGLYGLRRPARRIADLLEEMGIAPLADVLVARLSSGQAVRAGLCKALLNEPELLLLDEPTAYLDPGIALRTRGLLRRHRDSRGMTILLTSHDLAEVEELCGRIVLLRRGRIAACGTPGEVARAVLGRRDDASLRDAFLAVATLDG